MECPEGQLGHLLGAARTRGKTVNKMLREKGEVSTAGTSVLAAIRAAWWDDFETGMRNSDRKKVRRDQLKESKAVNFFYPMVTRGYTAPRHTAHYPGSQ